MEEGQICIYCGVGNPVRGSRCRECNSWLDNREIDVEILEKAWRFGVLQKSLRSGGVWNIFWGSIAILLGLSTISESSTNGFLLLIGSFLVITGFVARGNLSIGGIVGDGIGLLMVGIWNVALTIMNISDGYQPGFWGTLGVLQILWGIGRLLQIPSYNKVADASIPIVNHIERLVHFVQETPKSEKIIEIQVKSNRWKALLMPEMVLLVTDRAKEARFVPRSQFRLTIIKEPRPTKPVMVSIGLGKETWSGTISAEHLNRYDKSSSALEVMGPVSGVEEIASKGEKPTSLEPVALSQPVLEADMNTFGAAIAIGTSTAIGSMRCSRCSQERIPADKYCRTCGYKYDDAEFCPNCSQELIPGDRFCRMCGVNFAQFRPGDELFQRPKSAPSRVPSPETS